MKIVTSFYKNVTSLAKAPSGDEKWHKMPRLKNPYNALDNAYRLLVDDGGVSDADGRNMMKEEVNFENGVWVYKYRSGRAVLYVPVLSRKLTNGEYTHWVIEGPVDTLPKALVSALAFITSGVSKSLSQGQG